VYWSQRRSKRGRETDDVDVIARVLAGERDLFRILVTRHGVLAKRTAILCGAGDDADDVVQEAFVAAYRALPRFRKGEPFRPWLLRIVVNRSHNAVRARNRAQKLADRVATWDQRALEWDPATGALSVERREALVAALGRHSAPDREILVVRFLLDLSETDAALMLKMPKGTVKSRTARALQKLRLVVAELNVEAGIGHG
jgi:RNA polymerase sigma-70 factor (ECF subfamily)